MQRLALPLGLENIHRTLQRAFDLDARANADHDEAVLRVLLCIRLSPEGAMRAKDISIQMLKSTSHMSRLIDRAESHGLVERLPDPRDRRAHRVAVVAVAAETAAAQACARAYGGGPDRAARGSPRRRHSAGRPARGPVRCPGSAVRRLPVPPAYTGRPDCAEHGIAALTREGVKRVTMADRQPL